jgi:ferrochelatase
MLLLLLLWVWSGVCRELGASGVKSLLAVPISFVSEHIETLEEIDMEYR